MLRSQMHHEQYSNLGIFRVAVDDLIQRIQENGGPIELQQLFFRFTLDTTTAFLFGKSVRSLNDYNSTSEAMSEGTFLSSFDTAQRWVTKRFGLGSLS
jgi:hypothetical protein